MCVIACCLLLSWSCVCVCVSLIMCHYVALCVCAWFLSVILCGIGARHWLMPCSSRGHSMGGARLHCAVRCCHDLCRSFVSHRSSSVVKRQTTRYQGIDPGSKGSVLRDRLKSPRWAGPAARSSVWVLLLFVPQKLLLLHLRDDALIRADAQTAWSR